MASFDLSLSLRTIDAVPALVRARSTDFEELNGRVLGDSENLQASLDGAAGQFTSILAWDIGTLSAEDRQLWVDTAVALTYAAMVSDMWADHVEEFRDGRDELMEEWRTAVTDREGRVPGKYASSLITSTFPEREWYFWAEENTCRDLYDELVDKRENIQGRFDTLWNTYQEHVEEIGDMLEEGPTKANVQKLIDGGQANWAFYNLDPNKYTMLVDQNELTEENAQEWSTELAAYWSGDKPLDDRYHELMLVMAMIGTNAKQAQNTGSGFRSEEIDFLEAFYTNLEMEGGGHHTGVLSVPAWMEGDHMSGEERAHALGVLGDGLLTLSDEDLGGGYDLLPQSVRRAAEGPFLHLPGENEMPYHLVSYQEDARALSQLLRYTDDELQGGDAFSTNLTLGAGAYMHYWGAEGEDGWVVSEELAPLVEVGTRNEDANHYILTGEYPNGKTEIPGLPELAPHERTNAVEGILTYEWHDDGATARGLVDWMAEDALSEDDEVRERAGTAFAGFMETITEPEMYEQLINTGVHVTEGDNEYEDAVFTQFNTELGLGLVDVFDANIYSFATSDVWESENLPVEGVGAFDPESGTARLGAEERARFMHYLMGGDESAARLIQSVDVYQQIETAAFLENGRPEDNARGLGTLQGLLEEATGRDAQDRKEDLGDQVDRDKAIAEFFVGEATGLSKKIPLIGTAVSKGMALGGDGIVDAIIDGDYEVVPRGATYSGEINRVRNFEVEALEYVAHNDPSKFNEVRYNGDFQDLIEGGVVTVRQDGRVLDAEDITDDFTFDSDVTVSVEKNSDNWNEGFRQDGGRWSMDASMGNVIGDVPFTTSDGRTYPGDTRVGQFTGEFDRAYEDVRSYFDPDQRGDDDGE
ncbi:hypothetical protein PWG71_27400 [Nocardiopsis sp. N85]|uniref:TPR repeat region-containing protein n=1 Tax=Nocardiopsis sp. N85 TaxID=3029400 RepID=UPI00237FA90C|nr:hypothetical protein [Nocardiopsis sp. N85]MDE3725124.1 hypothetical protein [Nocardiopsis sp. N85]